MTNISYIHFENTLNDLIDCQKALDQEKYKGFNIYEQKTIHELVHVCKTISERYSNIVFNFSKEKNEDNNLLDNDKKDEHEDEDEDDIIEDEDDNFWNHHPPSFLFKS